MYPLLECRNISARRAGKHVEFGRDVLFPDHFILACAFYKYRQRNLAFPLKYQQFTGTIRLYGGLNSYISSIIILNENAFCFNIDILSACKFPVFAGRE
jgi:hypothetical protein